MKLDPVAALEAAKQVIRDDLVGYCSYHGSGDKNCCGSWSDDVYYYFFGDDDLKRVVSAALSVAWIDVQP